MLPFLLGLVSGCGAAPEQIAASGIDELVIPTPQPRAADFVTEIDNPFLPLQPGAVWVYEVTGAVGAQTTTVTVTDDILAIQGVRTTVVRALVREEDGEVVEDRFDWFAQDRRGNVWSFGRTSTAYGDAGEVSTQGSWKAGVSGAQAGLAMAAVPRVGDGYERGYFPGVAEDRATVLALDGEVSVPTGAYDDLLVTEESTPLEPGRVEVKYYARGLGLVATETSGVPAERRDLVSYTAP